ncbi:unnamed protein product [Anisakis simplex]|uniref:Transposase n=1 Tax=Anisakis simplex TaxID=6269 RepID=A0A0M3JUB4_ANISI|nr:unnamed protein product [Anisakis simplex]
MVRCASTQQDDRKAVIIMREFAKQNIDLSRTRHSTSDKLELSEEGAKDTFFSMGQLNGTPHQGTDRFVIRNTISIKRVPIIPVSRYNASAYQP